MPLMVSYAFRISPAARVPFMFRLRYVTLGRFRYVSGSWNESDTQMKRRMRRIRETQMGRI